MCKWFASRSTQNHSVNFLQAGCSSWHPTNSVEPLKAHTVQVKHNVEWWLYIYQLHWWQMIRAWHVHGIIYVIWEWLGSICCLYWLFLSDPAVRAEDNQAWYCTYRLVVRMHCFYSRYFLGSARVLFKSVIAWVCYFKIHLWHTSCNGSKACIWVCFHLDIDLAWSAAVAAGITWSCITTAVLLSTP